DLFTDAGDAMGWQPPALDDDPPDPVCVEAWALAWDGDNPAAIDSEAAYFRFVFPRVEAQLGSFSLGEEFAAIPINCQSTGNANLTANGPFDDFPTYVSDAGGVTSSFGVFLEPESALPEVGCELVELPAQAS